MHHLELNVHLLSGGVAATVCHESSTLGKLQERALVKHREFGNIYQFVFTQNKIGKEGVPCM